MSRQHNYCEKLKVWLFLSYVKSNSNRQYHLRLTQVQIMLDQCSLAEQTPLKSPTHIYSHFKLHVARQCLLVNIPLQRVCWINILSEFLKKGKREAWRNETEGGEKDKWSLHKCGRSSRGDSWDKGKQSGQWRICDKTSDRSMSTGPMVRAALRDTPA